MKLRGIAISQFKEDVFGKISLPSGPPPPKKKKIFLKLLPNKFIHFSFTKKLNLISHLHASITSYYLNKKHTTKVFTKRTSIYLFIKIYIFTR
jgi:hypothetical protein